MNGPVQGFPPLLDLGRVPPGPVLVVAPHPDDEILGCGGAIALHVERGDPVHVALVTAGEAGGDGARRLDESRRSARHLGDTTVRCLGSRDGAVAADGRLPDRLAEALAEVAPSVVYAPSPFEMHPDHVATLDALAAAFARRAGEPAPTLLLYEVNTECMASFLLDVSGVWEKKRRALEEFASQIEVTDVVGKADARARARTINVDLPDVTHAEGFLELPPGRLDDARARLAALGRGLGLRAARSTVTAVISTWNKKDAVLANVEALRAGTRPPDEIVVVDNHSSDGTAAALRERFPDVVVVEQPHDRAGACETFNIGFRTASCDLVAIMDDDVVCTPGWLAALVAHMEREPDSTAMVSSRVVEPGMPRAYVDAEVARGNYYASTFRGCGTLARKSVLDETGGYDERFFIYGNERDLAARVLARGGRILQVADAVVHHATPFGMKAGRRSLYYHVRNYWLYAFKHLRWGDLLRSTLGLARKSRAVGDDGLEATGTIGLSRALAETPGARWIVAKATLNALANLPYCLARRSVVEAPDFRLPGA